MKKIDWLYNLGPVITIWMVFMLAHASQVTVAVACLATYGLGIFLDIVLWVMGIESHYREARRFPCKLAKDSEIIL